jgi:hypothetical protein
MTVDVGKSLVPCRGGSERMAGWRACEQRRLVVEVLE